MLIILSLLCLIFIILVILYIKNSTQKKLDQQLYIYQQLKFDDAPKRPRVSNGHQPLFKVSNVSRKTFSMNDFETSFISHLPPPNVPKINAPRPSYKFTDDEINSKRSLLRNSYNISTQNNPTVIQPSLQTTMNVTPSVLYPVVSSSIPSSTLNQLTITKPLQTFVPSNVPVQPNKLNSQNPFNKTPLTQFNVITPSTTSPNFSSSISSKSLSSSYFQQPPIPPQSKTPPMYERVRAPSPIQKPELAAYSPGIQRNQIRPSLQRHFAELSLNTKKFDTPTGRSLKENEEDSPLKKKNQPESDISYSEDPYIEVDN
ncbi:hypothetical protein EDI_188540 [Entamoeba dispar SAW760]|uniref:Uncharacterized protein n=1 Tax=Entamoeba dispar (strain ATCC PRA-260 / SAW760) TaxID=370354 RepID=B0ERF7_ENTDS|nr:uncharacterized protein EDI_188540 [Entamoeba dispar SAW760]EDR22886.1 hypothetical protein EDI_188540 [Entamoeba dispar SAW760]|eukprot:EDR22886.1 hypothetical protein EDI_188540 [Entamoeba dispar SAW760]